MSVVRSLNKLLVFILMGVSFTHKYNPIEEPCHCKSKAWGLCSEGLHRTGKEKKKDLVADLLVFLLVYHTRKA